MADLTADAHLEVKGKVYSEKWTVDSTAARTIYKGQPMIIDQDVDTSHVVQFVDAVVVAATDVFIGIAAEGKVVAIGAVEADQLIEIYMEPTIVGFKSTVFSAGDEGKTVYMSDSGTLSATVADNPVLGVVHSIDAGRGITWVQLKSPVICSGA